MVEPKQRYRRVQRLTNMRENPLVGKAEIATGSLFRFVLVLPCERRTTFRRYVIFLTPKKFLGKTL